MRASKLNLINKLNYRHPQNQQSSRHCSAHLFSHSAEYYFLDKAAAAITKSFFITFSDFAIHYLCLLSILPLHESFKKNLLPLSKKIFPELQKFHSHSMCGEGGKEIFGIFNEMRFSRMVNIN